MRNKEGWSDGALIESNPGQGAGGNDGSAAASGDAVGDEEDEPEDNDKPQNSSSASVVLLYQQRAHPFSLYAVTHILGMTYYWTHLNDEDKVNIQSSGDVNYQWSGPT